MGNEGVRSGHGGGVKDEWLGAVEAKGVNKGVGRRID